MASKKNRQTPRTHEQTINTSLAEILSGLGRTWTMYAEDVGRIFEEGGRPDILIEKSDGWPIVIEAEVGNHRQAEIEARSRLGKTISASSHKVHAAVALVYPATLRSHRGQNLRNALRVARFEYVIFSTDQNEQTIRFPSLGWISGGIKELAILLHRFGPEGPSEQARSGVVTEKLSVPDIAAQCINALVPANVHHLEDRGAAASRRC